MKKQNGSYREVMAAWLVLTLMPTAGVLPAVAGESVQAARGQDTERPRGEETERPHGHNRQA